MTLLRFTAPNGVQSICGFDSLDDFLRVSLVDILTTFYQSTYRYCRALLQQRDVLDGIKRLDFDLAIYDAVDQCSKLLADYIDIPFIVLHTSGMESILPRNPAFLPSMVTSYTDDMTLWQRSMNSLGYLVQNVIVHVTYNYYQQLRLEQNVNTSLSVYDSFNRAALRFILGEWGLDYVGPTQPSHILLGGVVYAQPEPIPQELSRFLQNSHPNGVIVVSFGTIARVFGPTYRELFAEALAQLPYSVIWRYDEEPRPARLGNNTLLLSWIPQSQLLDDKRVRAFVTHCGMNAAYETARAGVPVVAIPLFADQFFQASKLINHVQMGEKLNIRRLTSQQLHDVILRVANSERYRRNGVAISRVMRDRPFSQHEQVTRWVDYVITHGGAQHLHCKGFDLAWYQYYLLDVSGVLFCLSASLLSAIYLTIKLIFRFVKCKYRGFREHVSTRIADSSVSSKLHEYAKLLAAGQSTDVASQFRDVK